MKVLNKIALAARNCPGETASRAIVATLLLEAGLFTLWHLQALPAEAALSISALLLACCLIFISAICDLYND